MCKIFKTFKKFLIAGAIVMAQTIAFMIYANYSDAAQ